MFQVTINAAEPDRRSPTGFTNVATLTLCTCADRSTAEYICERAFESSDYIKMRGVLTMLYPSAVIGTGVRPVVTDIVPQR